MPPHPATHPPTHPPARAALATEVCRTASPALLGSAAMLLAHLANTQEHFEELPERAFKQLAKVGRHTVRDVED